MSSSYFLMKFEFPSIPTGISHGKESNFHKEQLCQAVLNLDPGNLHNYSPVLWMKHYRISPIIFILGFRLKKKKVHSIIRKRKERKIRKKKKKTRGKSRCPPLTMLPLSGIKRLPFFQWCHLLPLLRFLQWRFVSILPFSFRIWIWFIYLFFHKVEHSIRGNSLHITPCANVPSMTRTAWLAGKAPHLIIVCICLMVLQLSKEFPHTQTLVISSTLQVYYPVSIFCWTLHCSNLKLPGADETWKF